LVATVACGSYPASLAPASERQDHTTSPSAATSFVRALFAHLTLPRPPHPAPNVRDDRDTPLSWDGMESQYSCFYLAVKQNSENQKLNKASFSSTMRDPAPDE